MTKLQARDWQAGLELLQGNPQLAWVRDDVSGGYPLHMAAYHVSTGRCSSGQLPENNQ